MLAMGELNLNHRAKGVADELIARADAIGAVVHNVGGARVIDAGHKQRGGLAAGVYLARICLADLANIELGGMTIGDHPLAAVEVAVDNPVAACMASQYAGWQISVGKYFAMGSGPMRAANGGEKLFDEIGHREKPMHAVGVLEGKLPSEEVVAYIAGKCGVSVENLTLAVARTSSIAGSLQVVARSVETALHKLHALHFDLKRVVSGFGTAPLAPVAKDDMAGIGRTNDAVLYGARVTLMVTGDDASLIDIGAKLPSSSSRDYGKPFGVLFKEYGHDFYKVDPLLFSPAVVSLQNIETGKTHTFGKINEAILAASFFD
jgi:methenyltetrahydromethanopterin cyclohydrolase